MEHQRTLEGPRPETPAQVRPGHGLLLPESCDLILLGLLTGFFPTDCSWWLLLPEKRDVQRKERWRSWAHRKDGQGREEVYFLWPGPLAAE